MVRLPSTTKKDGKFGMSRKFTEVHVAVIGHNFERSNRKRKQRYEFLPPIMIDEVKDALIAHAEGEILVHVANINLLLRTGGTAGQTGALQTVENELTTISQWDNQIKVLRKYFIAPPVNSA
eukprot:g1114.t1